MFAAQCLPDIGVESCWLWNTSFSFLEVMKAYALFLRRSSFFFRPADVCVNELNYFCLIVLLCFFFTDLVQWQNKQACKDCDALRGAALRSTHKSLQALCVCNLVSNKGWVVFSNRSARFLPHNRDLPDPLATSFKYAINCNTNWCSQRRRRSIFWLAAMSSSCRWKVA